MRAIPVFLLLAFTFAGPGHAEPRAFTGTLTIPVEDYTPIVVQGSGVADIAPNGTVSFPGGIFSWDQTRAVPDLPQVRDVRVTGSNAPGTITPGGLAQIGLNGRAFFDLRNPYPDLSLDIFPVGFGGSDADVFYDYGANGFRLYGSPWTAGVATVFDFATTYAPGTTSSSTGMDLRTPNGGGALWLVTPVVLITQIEGAFVERDGKFARLQLEFAPEPSVLALQGAAVLGLLAAGAARRWRARDASGPSERNGSRS